LKQIALGTAQYTQDYDERFFNQNIGNGYHFAHILQPYLKSRQIFLCPSAAGVPYNPTSDTYPADGKDHIWRYPATHIMVLMMVVTA
jgi:hypothetical protein